MDVFCEYLKIHNVNLVGYGYDGKTAVKLYVEKRPDIVFLDLMMPAPYDGFFALENIRRVDPSANVVIITADLRAETEEKLERLKPSKIIFKPFNVNEIATVIAEFRDKK